MQQVSGIMMSGISSRTVGHIGTNRPVAVVLAGLLTFLATDKVARLHVPNWLAFYLPVLVASFISLVAIARAPSGRPRVHAHRGAGYLAMDRLIGVGPWPAISRASLDPNMISEPEPKEV
jgi:hypothetical protein